jgi:hypothetical protein
VRLTMVCIFSRMAFASASFGSKLCSGQSPHQPHVDQRTEYSLMPFLMVETMALFLLPSLMASPSLMPSPFAAILLALVSLRSMSDRFFWILSRLAMAVGGMRSGSWMDGETSGGRGWFIYAVVQGKRLRSVASAHLSDV